MSERDLWFDPIEDGRPTRSKIALALAGLIAGLALLEATRGDYTGAVSSLLFAVYVWVGEARIVGSWLRGYQAALGSVQERFEEHTND